MSIRKISCQERLYERPLVLLVSGFMVQRSHRPTHADQAARSAFGRLARQWKFGGLLRPMPPPRGGAFARLAERRSACVRLSWLELRRRRPLHAHSVVAAGSRDTRQGTGKSVSRPRALRFGLGLSGRAASGYSRLSIRVRRSEL